MKRKSFVLIITSVATSISGLFVSLALQSAQAGVTGQYKGIRLPYAAGQARQVTGTHDTANGRHAIDFGMKLENVLAMHSGVVRTSKWDSIGGGNMLVIDHKDDYCSVYLHLNKTYVSPGQTVQQGQVIAESGNTGSPGMPYHLHASVTQKVNGACSANHSQEIAMIFDEKPNEELKFRDFIVSQNVSSITPPPTTSIPFATPVSSRLTITPSSLDLTISAGNLKGRTVYVQTWRPAVNGLSAKYFKPRQLTATGNTVTFNDLDEPGSTIPGVTYYTVASLEPIASGEAEKQRTSCFTATGGKYLCDAVVRR